MPLIEVEVKNGHWQLDGKPFSKLTGQERNHLNNFFIMTKPFDERNTEITPFHSYELKECIDHYHKTKEVIPLLNAIELFYMEMRKVKTDLTEGTLILRASDNNLVANKLDKAIEKLNRFINI